MRLITKLTMSALLALLGMMTFIQEPSASPETEEAVPQFTIKRFKLEGNSILEPAQVTSILDPYTGPQRDFGDIQQAMEQLEHAYRDRGYTM
ncbi:MAG: POTRA domain-containing protein, partial [Deltaproteobacteria bacterium]